ncbi:phosphate ABC transporter permease subunit PstC [Amedibacterium intestinale]|uniref:phosphate ABC transporter permease subunit PstC n=1 Tax=Amedibacterium intestinale TaxID=2583452 RepID=UPI000E4ED90F|nr:phosphate ABC transporter permease subunit PstC [Amedibacterium intestinale]RHO19063.1 phosphate ABC transporter permease subunit PstC [Eubacterium sp. AM18-26]RHO22583.1 phosphate ABC transporter permease subunit PstC [Eubacterium sp. AM18-10LB-B]RHO30132.1 phosphate ABC transporter permease subunit PstC [Erysipelotrichaceae bacterium AM17-60]BBK62741.1 phosphate transport system permease protein [Amedibacterium intestinale]
MKTYVRGYISSEKNAKKLKKDMRMRFLFMLAALLSSSAIAIIIIFISLKGISPFMPDYQYGQVNFLDFLFGTLWRKDQGVYGVGFIIINTLVSSFGALLISFPLSVLSALFIVKIAPKKVSAVMTTVVELLASIPSVVYGVFASGTITVLVSKLAASFGYVTAGGSSLLAVILLLAIMIYPTITSLSITAIRSVDPDIELGSLALGATKTQTNFKVVLASAKSGIFAGAILGIGRAFGEATAVAMVAGNKMFGPTVNLFDTTRTLTTTMLSGLKETSGLDYDIRFSAGLVLMAVILLSNLLLNLVKKKVGNVK